MTADQTMTNENLKSPARRLPVWATLVEAVRLPWTRRCHFGRLLVIPVAVTTLIFYLIGRATPELAEGAFPAAPSADSGLITVLGGLFSVLTFTLFAVSCHRSILLGDHAVARYGFAGWTGREFGFLLRMVQVGLVAMLWVVPVILIAWIVTVLGSQLGTQVVRVVLVVAAILCAPAYLYLLGRSSLVLPATAVDLSPTLASAWSQSMGNGWRLAIVIGAPASAMQVLITELISRVVPTSMGVFGEIGSYLFTSLGFYILFTVGVAVLSISFRELSGWGSSASAERQSS